MAIDNSLYDSLESTYVQIQSYLESNQLGPEHSAMIMKHEELSELLETLDIEALEEQSKDIHALHAQLDPIKEVSIKIVEDLSSSDDSVTKATKIASGLEKVFSKMTQLIL